jgi:alpha/beta superfamily hydrolase
MAEKKLRFESGDGIPLEGLLLEGHTGRGVVITHPHPLYGGDMYNNVVAILQSAFQETGFSTLRFNFRGVGASSGTYDDGDGEQQDVNAALEAMQDMGVSAVDLAGYSFGAWVNARAASEAGAVCARMIMIAPPAAMLDFSPALNLPSLTLVITGSRDAFAPPEMLKKQVPLWNPAARLEVIKGADHFFYGFEKTLADVLKAHL